MGLSPHQSLWTSVWIVDVRSGLHCKISSIVKHGNSFLVVNDDKRVEFTSSSVP